MKVILGLTSASLTLLRALWEMQEITGKQGRGQRPRGLHERWIAVLQSPAGHRRCLGNSLFGSVQALPIDDTLSDGRTEAC